MLAIGNHGSSTASERAARRDGLITSGPARIAHLALGAQIRRDLPHSPGSDILRTQEGSVRIAMRRRLPSGSASLRSGGVS